MKSFRTAWDFQGLLDHCWVPENQEHPSFKHLTLSDAPYASAQSRVVSPQEIAVSARPSATRLVQVLL